MSRYNIVLTACTKFNKLPKNKQTDFFYILALAYIERKDFTYPLERQLTHIEIMNYPEYIQDMLINYVS